MNELRDDTLQLVNDRFRKALEFIRNNPKGLDKYGLMDHANQVLIENRQESSLPTERT